MLDKTPRYYEILEEIVNYFPKARIVILKSFCCLKLNNRHLESKTYEELVHFYRDICIAPFKLQNFINSNSNNPNVLSLKYEDLITNTKGNIYQLCGFIGIDYDVEMINYSLNESYKGIFGDQQSVQSKSKPSQNKEKWVDKLNNKYWKPFFENYSFRRRFY